ncbi:hypothetical protein FOCC_FOCC017789, partial [Frankliniella occidentalis]
MLVKVILRDWMKMNCGRGPYNKDSRTSQWRHKRIESAQSQDRCSCVYHDDDSDDCNCEFHKTNSPSCPCEFHCIEETNVSLSHDDDSWLYEFSTEVSYLCTQLIIANFTLNYIEL